MSVNKQKNGKWLAQIDRKGLKRVRKTFSTQREAEIFEREHLASNQAGQNLTNDPRTLNELINLWFKYHGINLEDGQRVKNKLLAIASALGNPQADSITPEIFVEYRYKELETGLAPKTINHRHGYLSALYNKLRKLKVIDYHNPIGEVEFIKIQERQLSYLSSDQIDLLLSTIDTGTINESTWFVTQLCLRTGARWGEAEKLKVKQLQNDLITYEFTKSKKTRSIPVDPVFFKQLKKFISNKSPNDRIFTNCIGAFRRALKRSEIELPKGQCTHILRHSFASHFIMNGGNLLTLKKILGHADIQMTMRYAHLAPDHLKDAILYNPIA